MKAKRIDANQTDIAEQAKALGISYQSLHELGKGCPDAIFGYAGINLFVEIKDGKNKLNEMQIEYHNSWQGQIITIQNTNELITEFMLQGEKLHGKITFEMVMLLYKSLYKELKNEIDDLDFS